MSAYNAYTMGKKRPLQARLSFGLCTKHLLQSPTGDDRIHVEYIGDVLHRSFSPRGRKQGKPQQTDGFYKPLHGLCDEPLRKQHTADRTIRLPLPPIAFVPASTALLFVPAQHPRLFASPFRKERIRPGLEEEVGVEDSMTRLVRTRRFPTTVPSSSSARETTTAFTPDLPNCV
jgi:hypothetical protein